MHILIIPSFYRTPHEPGKGTFFREQALALRRAGARVGVMYYHDRDTHKLNPKAFRENHFQYIINTDDDLFELTRAAWSTSPGHSLGLRVWLWLCEGMFRKYVAQRGRPDILHAHCTLWGGVLARHLSTKYDIPYYITEHSSVFLQDRLSAQQTAQLRPALAQARGVFAVSQALARAVEPFVRDKKIQVMPNFIDTRRFGMPRESAPDSALRILAVGNLNHNKGFDTLIRAFATVFGHDRAAVARLTIVGQGELQESLTVLIHELDMEQSIQMPGGLAGSEVARMMCSHDILVSSSRHETFGVVIIEALASGMPVIATRSGAPQEFLTSDLGILVGVDNPEELGQAMLQMQTNLAKYPIERLKKFARENYDSEKLARQLIDILEHDSTQDRSKFDA